MSEERLTERVAELESELKGRDKKIEELTKERDEAQELVDQMREQLEGGNELIEQWIEVFEMQQGEDGQWLFDPAQSELWEAYDELLKQHKDLIAQWNKFERTVRSILTQQKRTNKLRRQTFDPSRAAAYRVRKKNHERLAEHIGDQLKAGTALLKAANGLGR